MAVDLKPTYWKVLLPNETVYVQASTVVFTETHVVFQRTTYSSGVGFSETLEAFHAERVRHLKRMPDGWEG